MVWTQASSPPLPVCGIRSLGLSCGSCAPVVSKADLQGAAQTPFLASGVPSLPPPGTGGYPRKGYQQTETPFQLDFQLKSILCCLLLGSSNLRDGTPGGDGEPGWVAGGPWSNQGLTSGQGRKMGNLANSVLLGAGIWHHRHARKGPGRRPRDLDLR